MPNIKELIIDNYVYFHHYRCGFFFYLIVFDHQKYSFPVPLEDVSDVSLNAKDKAIIFMNWINKAMKNSTFLKSS